MAIQPLPDETGMSALMPDACSSLARGDLVTRVATPGDACKANTAPRRSRGRPRLLVPRPWRIVERMAPTYTLQGARVTRVMYFPAIWLSGMEEPLLFPAMRRAPWASRGLREYEMFTSRYRATRWLLRITATFREFDFDLDGQDEGAA